MFGTILLEISKVRDDLVEGRATCEAEMKELQEKITKIDRELQAIDACEAALNGKRTGSKLVRGSKRDTVLAIIKDNAGITRGGIIEKLTAQGQDSPEKGLSNMLAALKKAQKITASDGKYAVTAS